MSSEESEDLDSGPLVSAGNDGWANVLLASNKVEFPKQDHWFYMSRLALSAQKYEEALTNFERHFS